jgi:hypothetical protein
MFDVSFGSNLIDIDTLFIWTGISYFLILYCSWDIPDIWEKVKGLESLFLSLIFGFSFSVLTNILLFPLLDLVVIVTSHLGEVLGLPLMADPITVEGSVVFSGIIGIIFTISIIIGATISYFSLGGSIIVKIIRKMFVYNDISNHFPRFQILKDFNLPQLLIFAIPMLFFSFAQVLLGLGGLYFCFAFEQNIGALWPGISILIKIFILIVSLFWIYFGGLLFTIYGRITLPFVLVIVGILRGYLDQLFNINQSAQTQIGEKLRWMDKHFNLVFLMACVFFMSVLLLKFQENQIQLIGMGIVFGIITILCALAVIPNVRFTHLKTTTGKIRRLFNRE